MVFQLVWLIGEELSCFDLAQGQHRYGDAFAYNSVATFTLSVFKVFCIPEAIGRH